MTEERRSPGPAAERQREQDAQIENLTRQLAEVVNGAGAEDRQDLREYALGLLKEETEATDAPPAHAATTNASPTNPIGMALLLGVVALPLVLLFAPVGLTLLAVALVMGLWGVISAVVRR